MTVLQALTALNHFGFDDTSLAPDCPLVEHLKSIDTARCCLKGDIWDTPVADL